MTDYSPAPSSLTGPERDEVGDEARDVMPGIRQRPTSEERWLLPVVVHDCPACARDGVEAACCLPVAFRRPEGVWSR